MTVPLCPRGAARPSSSSEPRTPGGAGLRAGRRGGEGSKGADGTFYNKVVKTIPSVNQRLNLSKEEFDKMGLGSRDVPSCP